MRSILVAAVLALLARSRPADACSCGLNPTPLSPRPAQTAVPTNAVLFFDTLLASPSGVTISGGVTYTTETHHGYVILRPTSPLAPNTTYTVTGTTAADPWSMTFTTGAGADTTAPTFAGISAIAPEYMQLTPASTGQGCANCAVHYSADHEVSRIHFAYPDPSPDTALLGVEIYIPGDSNPLVEYLGTPAQLANRLLDFQGCAPIAPDLNDGVTYCARITAYDAAGNPAGAAAESCAMPTSCAPDFDQATCSPTFTCLPGDNGSDPVTDPPGASHAGGCSTSPGSASAALLVLATAASRRRRSTSRARRARSA